MGGDGGDGGLHRFDVAHVDSGGLKGGRNDSGGSVAAREDFSDLLVGKFDRRCGLRKSDSDREKGRDEARSEEF